MAEKFLQRWSRRKAQALAGRVSVGATSTDAPPSSRNPASLADANAVNVSAASVAEASGNAPTLADVAALTADSDFSGFFVQGVDAGVRRAALKALVADPHFNVMDGLDIYIADYTQPSPVSAAMLATLQHVQSVLPPLDDKRPESQAGASQQDVVSTANNPAGHKDQPAHVEAADEAENTPTRESTGAPTIESTSELIDESEDKIKDELKDEASGDPETDSPDNTRKPAVNQNEYRLEASDIRQAHPAATVSSRNAILPPSSTPDALP